MKLLEVFVSLDKAGWKATIKEIEVKEGSKTYVGEGRRIDKDKIMKPINWNNYGCYFEFTTFCFEKDKDAAIKMLANEIKPKFISLKADVESAYAAVEKTLTIQ
jgi:hypothetical protein